MFEKLRGLFQQPAKKELQKEEQLPYEQQQQEVLRQKPLEGVDDLLESADSVLGDIDTVLKENEDDLRKSEASDELKQKESAEKRGFFGAIGRKSKEAGKWVSETAREGAEGAKKIAGALRQNSELRKEIAKKLEVGAERWLSVKGGGDILKAFAGKGDLTSLVRGMFEKGGEIKTTQKNIQEYAENIATHREEFKDRVQIKRFARVLKLLGKNESEIEEITGGVFDKEKNLVGGSFAPEKYYAYKQELESKGTHIVWLREEAKNDQEKKLKMEANIKEKIANERCFKRVLELLGKTAEEKKEYLKTGYDRTVYARLKAELLATKNVDGKSIENDLAQQRERAQSIVVQFEQDGRDDVLKDALKEGKKALKIATDEGRAKKGKEGMSSHTHTAKGYQETVQRELAIIAARYDEELRDVYKNRDEAVANVMKAHVEGVVNVWDETRDIANTVLTGLGRVELRAATGILSRMAKGAHEAAKTQRREKIAGQFYHEVRRIKAHEKRYNARNLQIQKLRERLKGFKEGTALGNTTFRDELMDFNRKYRREAEISLDKSGKPPFEQDEFVEFFKTNKDIEKYLKQAEDQYKNSREKLRSAHKGILEGGDGELPEHKYLWYLKETVAQRALDTFNNFKIWQNRSTLTQKQGVVRNIISAGQGLGDVFRFARFGADAEDLCEDIARGEVFGKEGGFMEYLQQGGEKLASRFYEDDLVHTLIDRHLHRDDLSEERKEILASLQEKLSHGGKMIGAEQTMLQKIEEQARDMHHKELSGEKLSELERGAIAQAKQAAAEEYGAHSVLEKIGRNLGEYNVKRSLSTLTELPYRIERGFHLAERGTGALIERLDQTGANIAKRAYGDDLTALVFQKEAVSGTRAMEEDSRERLLQYFTGGMKRDELTPEDREHLQKIEQDAAELGNKHRSGGELTDEEAALVAAAENKALIDYLDDGVLEKIASSAGRICEYLQGIPDPALRQEAETQLALIEIDPKKFAEGLRVCGAGMMGAGAYGHPELKKRIKKGLRGEEGFSKIHLAIGTLGFFALGTVILIFRDEIGDFVKDEGIDRVYPEGKRDREIADLVQQVRDINTSDGLDQQEDAILQNIDKIVSKRLQEGEKNKDDLATLESLVNDAISKKRTDDRFRLVGRIQMRKMLNEENFSTVFARSMSDTRNAISQKTDRQELYNYYFKLDGQLKELPSDKKGAVFELGRLRSNVDLITDLIDNTAASAIGRCIEWKGAVPVKEYFDFCFSRIDAKPFDEQAKDYRILTKELDMVQVKTDANKTDAKIVKVNPAQAEVLGKTKNDFTAEIQGKMKTFFDKQIAEADDFAKCAEILKKHQNASSLLQNSAEVEDRIYERVLTGMQKADARFGWIDLKYFADAIAFWSGSVQIGERDNALRFEKLEEFETVANELFPIKSQEEVDIVQTVFERNPSLKGKLAVVKVNDAWVFQKAVRPREDVVVEERLRPSKIDPQEPEAQTASQMLDTLYKSNPGLPEDFRTGIGEDRMKAQELMSAIGSFNTAASEHFSTEERNKILNEMPDKSAAGLKSSAQYIEAIDAFFNNPDEPLLKVEKEGSGYKDPFIIDISDSARAIAAAAFFEQLKKIGDNYYPRLGSLIGGPTDTETITEYRRAAFRSNHQLALEILHNMRDNIKNAVSGYVDKKVAAILIPTVGETVTGEEKTAKQNAITAYLEEIEESKKLMKRVGIEFAPQKEEDLKNRQARLDEMEATTAVSEIPLETVKPSIQIDHRVISPDGDGVDDEARIDVTFPEGTKAIEVNILDSKNEVVFRYTYESPGGSQDSFVWRGDTVTGLAPDGMYRVQFFTHDDTGSTVKRGDDLTIEVKKNEEPPLFQPLSIAELQDPENERVQEVIGEIRGHINAYNIDQVASILNEKCSPGTLSATLDALKVEDLKDLFAFTQGAKQTGKFNEDGLAEKISALAKEFYTARYDAERNRGMLELLLGNVLRKESSMLTLGDEQSLEDVIKLKIQAIGNKGYESFQDARNAGVVSSYDAYILDWPIVSAEEAKEKEGKRTLLQFLQAFVETQDEEVKKDAKSFIDRALKNESAEVLQTINKQIQRYEYLRGKVYVTEKGVAFGEAPPQQEPPEIVTLIQENTESGVSENQDQKIFDALANASAVFKENNYAQAIDVFTAVLKLNPSPEIAIKIHNNLGICYGKLGKFEEARNAYNEALKLNPRMTEARNNLGWLFLENGKVDDAIKEFQDGHSINPEDPHIWTNLAWAYYVKGEFQTAIEINLEILKAHPSELYARYNLGLANVCTGQLNDAEREYRKALESGKETPQYKSAVDDLRSLIAKNDKHKDGAQKMLEILEGLPPAIGEWGGNTYLEANKEELLKHGWKVEATEKSRLVSETERTIILEIDVNNGNGIPDSCLEINKATNKFEYFLYDEADGLLYDARDFLSDDEQRRIKDLEGEKYQNVKKRDYYFYKPLKDIFDKLRAAEKLVGSWNDSENYSTTIGQYIRGLADNMDAAYLFNYSAADTIDRINAGIRALESPPGYTTKAELVMLDIKSWFRNRHPEKKMLLVFYPDGTIDKEKTIEALGVFEVTRAAGEPFAGDSMRDIARALSDRDELHVIETADSEDVIKRINKDTPTNNSVHPLTEDELAEQNLPKLLNEYRVEFFLTGALWDDAPDTGTIPKPEGSTGDSSRSEEIINSYIISDLGRFTLDTGLEGEPLHTLVAEEVHGCHYSIESVCGMLNAHEDGKFTINQGTKFFCEQILARERGLIKKENGKWISTGEKEGFILGSADDITVLTHEIRHAEFEHLDKFKEAKQAFARLDPKGQYAFIVSNVMEARGYGADIVSLTVKLPNGKEESWQFDAYKKFVDPNDDNRHSNIENAPRILAMEFKKDTYQEYRPNNANNNEVSHYTEYYAYTHDKANDVPDEWYPSEQGKSITLPSAAKGMGEKSWSDMIREMQESRRRVHLSHAAESEPENDEQAERRGFVLALPAVHYEDTRSYTISDEYADELEGIAETINAYPTAKVLIEGHASNVGSSEENLELSRRRANAVMTYLVNEHGVDPTQLTAIGYGEDHPIVDNDTTENLKKNNRVEIMLLATEEVRDENKKR